MSPVEILQKARALLAQPGVWAKGDLAGRCGRHCAATAIGAVVDASAIHDGRARQTLFYEVRDLVRIAAQTNEMLPVWNDARERTLDEVLSVFDKASLLAGGAQ